jgi:hypothetical protein
MPRAVEEGLGPFAPSRCDVAFVDGGHLGEVPYWDIVHFSQLSKMGALLLVDDCLYPSVYPAIFTAKSQEYIGEISTYGSEKNACSLEDGPPSLCVSLFG